MTLRISEPVLDNKTCISELSISHVPLDSAWLAVTESGTLSLSLSDTLLLKCKQLLLK